MKNKKKGREILKITLVKVVKSNILIKKVTKSMITKKEKEMVKKKNTCGRS